MIMFIAITTGIYNNNMYINGNNKYKMNVL